MKLRSSSSPSSLEALAGPSEAVRETDQRGVQAGSPVLEPSRRSNPRALLLGSPRTVLARLTLGDPLKLRNLVSARLRIRHLLMDAERVYLVALAHCARDGCRYRAQQAFDAWLKQRVERAIDDVLDAGPADAEAERSSAAWADLARPLGLSAVNMARASVNFNALPLNSRTAFFYLVLDGRSLDEWALASGRCASDLAWDARRGRQVFLDFTQTGALSSANSKP